MKTALVFGGTGLTGEALLQNLSVDSRYSKIYSVVRKRSAQTLSKVEEIIFDYKNFDTLPSLTAQHVFSCLGTTIKKAGSQEAQRIIDRDYPISIAKYASKIGAEKMVCVSAVGADANSSNFYLRTKGEMEEGVKTNFTNAVFVRPSFLLGHRKEFRAGEKIGIYLFNLINPLMLGQLRKYRGIQVSKLSKAMIEACFKPGKQVLFYDDF